jgi:hypothetical protein
VEQRDYRVSFFDKATTIRSPSGMTARKAKSKGKTKADPPPVAKDGN